MGARSNGLGSKSNGAVEAPATEQQIVRALDGGIVVNVHVTPRAGRLGLAGMRGHALHVRVHASPVEGAANAELVSVLAAVFDVARSAISIVTGERSRQKCVRVAGIDAPTAVSRIAAIQGA